MPFDDCWVISGQNPGMNAQRMWIDSHCHLDAPELGAGLAAVSRVRAQARGLGVDRCVIPAVERSNWGAVRELAHALGDAYAVSYTHLTLPTSDLV